MNGKYIGTLVAGGLVIGGLSFYGGTIYAKAEQPNAANFVARAAGGNFPGGAVAGRAGGTRAGGAGIGLTSGEVVAKDDQGLTIKLSDGGSKNVFTSASTTISMMSDGSTDDVEIGTNVFINGTTNSDGSITASMIQIRPAGDFRMGIPPGVAPQQQ